MAGIRPTRSLVRIPPKAVNARRSMGVSGGSYEVRIGLMLLCLSSCILSHYFQGQIWHHVTKFKLAEHQICFILGGAHQRRKSAAPGIWWANYNYRAYLVQISPSKATQRIKQRWKPTTDGHYENRTSDLVLIEGDSWPDDLRCEIERCSLKVN